MERFQNNVDLHKHDAIGQIFIGMFIELTDQKISHFFSCMPGTLLAVVNGGVLAWMVVRVLSYVIIFLLFFRALIGVNQFKQIEIRSIIKWLGPPCYIQSTNIDKKCRIV